MARLSHGELFLPAAGKQLKGPPLIYCWLLTAPVSLACLSCVTLANQLTLLCLLSWRPVWEHLLEGGRAGRTGWGETTLGSPSPRGLSLDCVPEPDERPSISSAQLEKERPPRGCPQMGTRRLEEGLSKCKACHHCSQGVTTAPQVHLPSLHSALCLQEEVHDPEVSEGPGRGEMLSEPPL